MTRACGADDIKNILYPAPFRKLRFQMIDNNVKQVRFQTKNHKSRSITLEANLLAALKDWREKYPNRRFVFATASDLPIRHLLDVCKLTAYRAGLNCGKCPLCVKTGGKECAKWKLHKFRHSFATWSLQYGHLDLKTLQNLLGHSDIIMTSKYLSDDPNTQDKLNVAFAEV